MRAASRMPCVDALKAIACILIVLHHLAFYGPMSDSAYGLMPTVIDLFYQYGRMAVQAFFVVAGFLMVAKFAPHGSALVTNPLLLIYQRYLRLAIPYLVALACAVLCATLAREWLAADWIPETPDFAQLLSHVFFMQDLAGEEALSAGVWYVAIDLQLFALAALLLWCAGRIELRYPQWRYPGPLFIGALTAASLFAFNLDPEFDTTALYFFGAYGMGALAYWASRRQHGVFWLILLAIAVLAALLFEFRGRILVAGVVMLMLGWARQHDALERLRLPSWLTDLGRISYSVFLIHFPVCMIVNAVYFHFFAGDALAAVIGMLLAFALSIGAGALLFVWVENRSFTRPSRLPTGFWSAA